MTTLKNNNLLLNAAERGDAAEVQRLIPMSDPNENHSKALQIAAENGHAECVKLLIPVSDPKVNDSWALRWAAASGHSECVKLLIPVSDPKAYYSAALQWATGNGHTTCVDFLFDVSDAHMALQCLQDEYPDEPQTWQYLEEKVNEQQREALYNETIHVSQCLSKSIRKI